MNVALSSAWTNVRASAKSSSLSRTRRWRAERLRDRSQYDKGENDGDGYSNAKQKIAEWIVLHAWNVPVRPATPP
jgi:hypothetical protein